MSKIDFYTVIKFSFEIWVKLGETFMSITFEILMAKTIIHHLKLEILPKRLKIVVFAW